MKNKALTSFSKLLNLYILLFFAVVLAITPACNKDKVNPYDYELEFYTEAFEPFNFSENDTIKGLGPDLLRIICSDLGIPFSSTILPWEQAYATALSNPRAALYSTVLNAERKSLFKWAGPFATVDWTFYAASQNPVELSSLDEARAVPSIGVIADFAITQYLLSEGFTNLVVCNNNQDAFQKLLRGEISIFPSDKITAEAALSAIGKSIYDVRGKLTFRTDLVYFAFNKAVPDWVVEDFQQVIDESKRNGTLKALYQLYMQSANPPDVLQFYTEQYPPLTYRDNQGIITGFGTEMVQEIMKRQKSFHPINLTLWSNAYELALHNPNFCLFTMDRTPLRENLFQWVGPIGSNITYFYVRAGSGISINSLDEARNLGAVGTVSSWFSDQHLRSLGFDNLVTGADPAVMAAKLLSGEVDAFVCTNVTMPSILRVQGYTYNQVQPTFALLSSDYYIAFSKSTSAGTVTKWKQSLDATRQDGTYDAIFRKWFE